MTGWLDEFSSVHLECELNTYKSADDVFAFRFDCWNPRPTNARPVMEKVSHLFVIFFVSLGQTPQKKANPGTNPGPLPTWHLNMLKSQFVCFVWIKRNGKNHGFNIRNDFAHFFVPLSTVGISIYSQTVLLLEMLEKTISYLQVDQLLLNAHRMHVLFIKSWHWKVVSPKSIKDTGFRTRYLRHL